MVGHVVSQLIVFVFGIRQLQALGSSVSLVKLLVDLDKRTPASVSVDGLSQLGNGVAVPCLLIRLARNRLVSVVNLAVLALRLLWLLLGFG